MVRSAADGEERPIWQDFTALGYLDAEGAIQDSFNPDNPLFRLKVAEEFAGLSATIIDEMGKYLVKNRVINDCKKRKVNFDKQV